MPTTKVKLGSVIDINAKSIGRGYGYDEIAYLDIASVGTGTTDGATTMRLADAPGRAKRLVSAGDTILSTVRPNRRSFLFMKMPADNLVVSTGFAVLHPRAIDPRYLYYVVTHQRFTDYLSGHTKGAAYPVVDAETIANAEIELPPLPEQKRIASILSAYDDLIENNTRRIKILEEAAQALYKEWFVDFKFPGHEKVRLIDSHTEYGKIPERWEVKQIKDLISISPSTPIAKSVKLVPFLSMSALSHDGLMIDSTQVERRAITGGSRFINGDTLLPRISPCLEHGKIGYAQFLKDEEVCIGSTEFIVLRENVLPCEYVYCLAKDGKLRDEAQKSMAGASGRQRVASNFFNEYRVLSPSHKMLEMFTVISRKMFAEAETLRREELTATELRDASLKNLL